MLWLSANLGLLYMGWYHAAIGLAGFRVGMLFGDILPGSKQ